MCPQILLKLVQGLTDGAVRWLWDTSVSHFKPGGLCCSTTALSLISRMNAGAPPDKAIHLQSCWGPVMASLWHKGWNRLARGFFLVSMSAGQANYNFQHTPGVLSVHLEGTDSYGKDGGWSGHQAFFYQLNGVTVLSGLKYQDLSILLSILNVDIKVI